MESKEIKTSFFVPSLVFELGLSVYEFRLYSAYCRLADDDGVCSVSLSDLAKHTGISSGKLSTTKRELAKIGLVLLNPSQSDKPDEIRLVDLSEVSEEFYSLPEAERNDKLSDIQFRLKDLAKNHAPIRKGYIYILNADGTNYYKIGKAKELSNRIMKLQIQLPMPVRLVHSIPVSDTLEAELFLHNKYAAQRSNGEWFVLEQNEIKWLCTLNQQSDMF